MEWTKVLKCPRCGVRGLTLAAESGDELLPPRGLAGCDHCGRRFVIRDHILDLAQPGERRLLTVAGLSNDLPLLPWGYEKVWRPRSLTLLTGQPFPIEREIQLLNDWLLAQPTELIVDLGSSTDLYARGIGKQRRDAMIVSIDMATGMLRAGRYFAQGDGVNNIAHVRAPVQRLPFVDASVDALACGGSLNEFRSMSEALREARRIVKATGRLFAMNLLKGTSLGSRLGQWNAGLSGIRFPTLDQFNATLASTGWQPERQFVLGVVVFTLMRPNRTTPS